MSHAVDSVFAVLEAAMRFRVSRQAVLSGNVANADTPGYRRRDVHFDAVLGESILRLQTSNPTHISNAGSGSASYRSELGPRGTRPDGNGVDLDRELVLANRNAGAFTDAAAVYARLGALARTAIG